MVKPDQVTDPINQQQKNDDNYWEITGLPSKMKMYPKGTVIKGRPLKTLEVKKLATMNSTNMDDMINDVLVTSIMGLEVSDILASDKLYILFWLRANTYKESGFNVEFDCELCGMESEYEFNIDSIQTIDIEDDYDPLKVLTLPSSKDELVVKHMTIADEQQLTNFMKSHEKSLNTFDAEILDLAGQIGQIGGDVCNSLLKTYDYVSELDPSDFAYLTSYMEYISFGIKNSLEVKCQKCGGSTQTGVTFRSEFFLPKYKF